jgi:hypothetical protein
MVRLRYAGAILASFVVAEAVVCRDVRADDASPTDIAAARKLGVEGVKLANAGKCDEAIDRLDRAERLFHAPTILGRLGVCEVAVGKLVAGTESLQRVVREALPPNPPAAYVAAKARAQKVLDAALPRLAHLTVELRAPSGAKVAVKVDGETLSDALVGVSHPVDPGEHNLEATAPDYLTATTKVTLAEGQNTSATLTLEPDPEAEKRRLVANVAMVPPPPPVDVSRSTPRTLGYIGLGLGGAGVVVGTVMGALALSKARDLDHACPNQQCGPSSQSELDAARTDGTVSTVGFVAGGVFVAAGVALLLWPESAQGKAAGVTVRPMLGIASAGAQGSF